MTWDVWYNDIATRITLAKRVFFQRRKVLMPTIGLKGIGKSVSVEYNI